MSLYTKAIPIIIISVLLNAFAQIALKKAVGAAGMEWSLGPLIRLFIHPWMIVCMACYAFSIVIWANVVKLVPANFAFPFMALGFVCVTLMAKFFLGETVPRMRWLALIVIVIGVCLQAFSVDSGTETAKGASDNNKGHLQNFKDFEV